MKIKDYLTRWLRREETNTLYDNSLVVWGDLCMAERMPFANLVFLNVCDLLTDIAAEVVWRRLSGDAAIYAAFKAFYDVWGKYVLNRLYVDGFVVIGRRGNDFRVMSPAEYVQVSQDDKTRVVAVDEDTLCYVMRSQTFALTQMSDKQLLHPWLQYLDNVLNASNTVSARMGAAVIMSPQMPTGAPAATPLTEKQKQELETDMSKGYGALAQQKQVMLLSRPVQTQIINLAGLDQKTQEKAKLAILAIADRIKVPANQVAIIDATSSRSLANGTELREGDLAKYRSFRRLLNVTFYQMAEDFGLAVDYTIENEPKTTQGDTIEQ